MLRSVSASRPPSPANPVAAFDLARLDDAFYADPFPLYRAMRERDPVHRMPDGSLFLTRWADLDCIYRDTRTFSSDKRAEFGAKYGDAPLFEHHTTSLVFNDPPLHTRVRRLIVGALTPRALSTMEPGLRTLVDRLLDGLAVKGAADLIEDFAAAIPIEVIGNLLDIPTEERGPLRGWSLAILGALEPRLTAEQEACGNEAVTEFLDYLRILVAQRRARPGDPATDVLTRLIQGESDGERLTETELLHQCVFLLNAGHETTTNLIGNALELLARFPDERARLLRAPALIPTAVEEVLRYESSNQLGNRRVAEDTEIGGVAVPTGTFLTLCIGAANRDPARFEDPEHFDVGRQPNRHLAFAGGAHTCAGMNLARIEARIALAAFLARFPDYALTAPPVRARRARFRGFTAMPTRLGSLR
uniref:Cytochrome P450 monooxygenase n=1 Tax=Stigmatella aurantiaca TaxID=41 RepID=Q8RJZ4_STIAU|nr:cytochrome P450 monooxygenase [Stigmatella aurantiaca Sg a15]